MNKQLHIITKSDIDRHTKTVPCYSIGVFTYAKCLISNKLPPPPTI